MAIPASTVLVYLGGDDAPLLVGKAFINARRSVLTTTFRYDDAYLENPKAQQISPDLPKRGRLSVNGLPGAMADGVPDRWGRQLIERALNMEARAAGRTPSIITEVDYLLGVSDLMRQGALRYRQEGSDSFLAEGVSVPLLIDLPKVLQASDALADSDSADELAAIKFLLQAGSSALGGARPKASVSDGKTLYIAKFPRSSDQWDVMSWEMTALDLAELCGIKIPVSRLVDIGGRNVLLLERFDRSGDLRIGYISAMSMLGGVDGGQCDYTEVAEAISDYGSSVLLDLEQLWRRIAFSIAIHNTDDHLRNLGFLWSGSGWELSPAFDINPNPIASSPRATFIGYQNLPEGELHGLMDSAKNFQIDQARANEIWTEVINAISSWRQVATAHGISTSEQKIFAPVLDKHLSA